MVKALAISSDVYFYEIGGGFQDQKGLGILNIEKYMGLENQLNYIYLFKIPVFCSFIAILLAFLLTYFNIQNCAKNKF